MEDTVTISLEKYKEMEKEIETLREEKTVVKEVYPDRIIILLTISLWLYIIISLV